MIQLIEDHRDDHGVEPICRVLPIAPATFYDNMAKRADPSRLSDRAKRDAELKPEIERVLSKISKSTACGRSGVRCTGKALVLRAAQSHV